MTSSELDVIQSLWLGDFTTMERLAVCSFLENGHEFHLYAYKSLRGVPDGVRLRDGNEIVSSDRIFKDSRGTFAGFANAFRYKLLLERGGWWVDTDAVCLQPFQAASEHLLALEPDRTIATGVIKAPAGSELIARAWEESQRIGTKNVEWGKAGPALMGRLVDEMGFTDVETDPSVFYPIDWSDWRDLIAPGAPVEIGPRTKSVHLWSSLWTRNGADKDVEYPADCLYEELKRRFRVPQVKPALHRRLRRSLSGR